MFTFVMADPCDLKNNQLRSWREFCEKFCLLPGAQHTLVADDLVSRLTIVGSSPGNWVRRELDSAQDPVDYACRLLWAALWCGELTAYASQPTRKVAFKIRTEAWALGTRDWHETQQSIEEGVLSIKVPRRHENDLDRELAYRPMFINDAQAKRWLKIKPPSLAKQREAARYIIAEHKHKVMRRRDFIRITQDRLPGLSKAAGEKLWGKYAPKRWKLAGTKKYIPD